MHGCIHRSVRGLGSSLSCQYRVHLLTAAVENSVLAGYESGHIILWNGLGSSPQAACEAQPFAELICAIARSQTGEILLSGAVDV